MFALLLSASALALDFPDYTAQQRLYIAPSTYPFAHARLDQALAGTEHDIRVVVFEQVIDGHIAPGRATETEDALEDLAASWRASADRTGFRPDESSIIMLGMDDREVRILGAGRWDVELGLHNDALLPVIDENFLPLARTGDLDGALAATVQGLDERIHYERFVRPEEEEAAARARQGVAAAGVCGFGLLILGFFGVRARASRAHFEAALAQHREDLDFAERTLAELVISAELAEKVSVLQDKGERTTEVYRAVTGDLDRLQVGLSTLRRHLDAIAAAPKASWALRVAPWEHALERLESGIPTEPESVEQRLFHGQSEPETVSIASFTATLEQRFTAAREGWESLCEAAELRLKPAITVIGDLGLASLRRRLNTAGLPESWIAAHPLLPSPEAALEQLDATRRADPLAFAEACEQATERVSQLAQDIADLLEDKERAADAAEHALAAPDVPAGTVVRDPQERPDEAPLRAARATLESALQAGVDFRVVDQAASEVVEAAVELKRRKDQANAAPKEAPEAIRQAEEQLAKLTEQSKAAEQRIARFVEQHLPEGLAGAYNELAEARADIAQMGQAIERARAAELETDMVGALLGARAAMTERGEAVVNLDELAKVLSALDTARADAEHLITHMDQMRQHHLSRLSQWGLGPDALHEGDAMRAKLPPLQGPQDYAAVVARVRTINGVWEKHAEQLVSREILRQKAAAEAAERALRAATYARSSTTSRSSFSSSSRSSFSSSSSRSSSSSAGRSFSSSSRSAGRSFSSGGRSGGRKF